jgi:predicted porin
VGLVNEYVDVGVSYPWIQAPLVIYSTSPSGPQATREAYTGADVLWTKYIGDWTVGADLYGGQVDLTGMTIKKMRGITARANWNEQIVMQASTYTGDMMAADPTTPMGMMMNKKSHSATEVGAKVDWNNVIAYAEWAKVKMDVKMMGVSTNNSTSWYTTLGYRFAHRIVPHITYQDWKQGDGDGHKISTIGINYIVSPEAVLKLEYSNIKTDKAGLFVNDTGTPTAPSGDTKMTSIAVDVVF